MQEVRDIFGIWASIADLARDLELPYHTVAKWHQRGRIPSEFWAALIAAAARRGTTVTAQQLVHAARRRRSDKRAESRAAAL